MYVAVFTAVECSPVGAKDDFPAVTCAAGNRITTNDHYLSVERDMKNGRLIQQTHLDNDAGVDIVGPIIVAVYRVADKIFDTTIERCLLMQAAQRELVIYIAQTLGNDGWLCSS